MLRNLNNFLSNFELLFKREFAFFGQLLLILPHPTPLHLPGKTRHCEALMPAGDSSSLDYNTCEDLSISILRELRYEDVVEACQVLQEGYEIAPEGDPVVVQHDEGCYTETVNTETTSTDTSDAPTASIAPNAEIISEQLGGKKSASPGTVT